MWWGPIAVFFCAAANYCWYRWPAGMMRSRGSGAWPQVDDLSGKGLRRLQGRSLAAAGWLAVAGVIWSAAILVGVFDEDEPCIRRYASSDRCIEVDDSP